MSLFSFTKLPKHKKFNYHPRYFDPEKEEREARRNIQFKAGGMAEQKGSRIVGSFRNNRIVHRSRRDSAASRIRMFLIVSMFFPVFLYYTDRISGIFAIAIIFLILIVFIQRVRKIS